MMASDLETNPNDVKSLINLSKLNYKEVMRIEKSCDIWNVNFQHGAFKMMPNKILKELNSSK